MILNKDINVCKDCKHFRPNNSSWYNSRYNIQYGYCGNPNIIKKDMVTGSDILYEARYVRADENLCGVSGRFFDKENNVILRVLKNNKPRLTPYGYTLLCVGAGVVTLHLLKHH